MKIHLTKNKYIISDGYDMAVYSITEYKDKDGNSRERRTRLSGHHTDFEHLFDSYLRKEFLGSEIEGELAELAALVKKTRNEIRGWWKTLDKSLEE